MDKILNMTEFNYHCTCMDDLFMSGNEWIISKDLNNNKVLYKDSWESLGLQGDPTNPFWRRSALGFLWGEWCWSWNSSTLATSCKDLTHWKRLWCWEGLGAGGEGDDRGWDGWMASPTWWMWVWVNSGSWWRTGRPGMLRFMGSQRVRHDWATELNWTDPSWDLGLRIGLFQSCGHCWVFQICWHTECETLMAPYFRDILYFRLFSKLWGLLSFFYGIHTILTLVDTMVIWIKFAHSCPF